MGAPPLAQRRRRPPALAACLLALLLPLASAQECTVPGVPCTDADVGPGESCGDVEDLCACSDELLCLIPPSSGLIPQWVLGVVLYSFGAMMINLGSNIVKYGHTQREKALEAGDKPGEEKATKLKVGGWVLFSVGGGFNFLSFSYGTQSLLSALAAIQFVTNIFFGALVNGETVTMRIVLGTIGEGTKQMPTTT